MLKINSSGFDGLNSMLLDLGGVLGKKAVRAAARKAMTPVLNEIKATAPYDAITQDGIHLRESFKLKVSGRTKRLQRKGSDTFLVASVMTANKEVEKYASLIEFGRREFTQRRTNAFGIKTDPFNVLVHASDPKPFMRPAMRKHADQVIDIFLTEVRAEIEKLELKKLKQKGL
ncbi:HK97-gp10 family putative phage morphogenesis protein [Shewanella frigidimarina]|uniref:HK97-gp10 family putative phage morphogenesis protein n=1 Tax=Shewanella frigidimarina TaxID=56812 RepID=UPI003D79C761